MEQRPNYDFLLEKKLKAEDPLLHKRISSSIFVLQHMLSAFLDRFPSFTDHSILHSMDVLNYCNELIGEEQVQKLTNEECYVLIMACYLHDIGMGISEKDYGEFSKEIAFAEFFLTHDRADAAGTIRSFHHDYSGLFIRKYASLFDIPDEELVFAVIQVARGHRVTDLFDPVEYPDIKRAEGVIRTSYLAAVLRLADEIDVASDRNPEILFDASRITVPGSVEAFGTHESIRRVEVTEDAVILYTMPISPEYEALIEKLAGKIRKVLDYCRRVAEQRTELRIRQKQVIIRPIIQ